MQYAGGHCCCADACVWLCHATRRCAKVPLTKELLNSVASARSRYHVHLDQERRKTEWEAQGQKRKAAEDYLEELKKRKKNILEVSEDLARDANRCQKRLRARPAARWPSSSPSQIFWGGAARWSWLSLRQGAQSDLLACVCLLGHPTWFVLSSTDMLYKCVGQTCSRGLTLTFCHANSKAYMDVLGRGGSCETLSLWGVGRCRLTINCVIGNH